jgi:hypothetical protein
MLRSVLAAALLAAPPAFAGYVYEDLPWGDTTTAQDVNDHGEVLYCCFSDSEFSAALLGATMLHGEGGAPAVAEDVNNAGHVLGYSMKGSAWVSTMWIDGAPYDLTDPSNAGLQFVPDPGPKFADDFDLSALKIEGLPDCFQTGFCRPLWALTNARGDLIFEYSIAHFVTTNAALWFDGHAEPASVPEPSSLLLAALACLAALYTLPILSSHSPQASCARR